MTHHTVELEDSRPFTIQPQRLGPVASDELQIMVEEMIANDVITPCQSPWASPVMLVDTKDGTKRFCVDY